ncbi:DUF2156 domain-containing protein [Arthrobacter sp. I2-34]|uniref:DUF2156 domain-containing protein n=1 Tax=Arthrobacter hankyongi TaxID=2904801 RepID=A0ABS9LAP1_9MICC|nr:DUF2156 domain-containing protein [Arthrobacter hankyongi]MCG2623720.1 DUF2156 domain-containing protein [Arthrobacter hankyongi]
MDSSELSRTATAIPRSLGSRLLRRATGAPLTLGYLAALWVLGLADSSTVLGAHERFRETAAIAADSFPEEWWAVLASALWAPDLAAYLTGSVLVLLVGLAFEKRLGSLRFAAAAVAGHLCGTLATAGLALAVRGLDDSWAQALVGSDFLGPTALACSALAAGSASVGAFWRRRIRTVLLTLLVVLVLYAGYFSDCVLLVAAATGLVLGPRLTGRTSRRFHATGTLRELRVLAAAVIAASAVGPVVAALDSEALGPLSDLQYVFTAIETRDPGEIHDLCTSGTDLAECLMAQAQQRSGMAAIFMAVIPSFLLLLCAAGLRRGRRAAWLAAVLVYGVMSVVAGTNIVSLAAEDAAALANLDFGETVDQVVPLIVPMLLLTALLLAGRLFTVRAPHGTYRTLAARVAVAGLAAATVYVAGASALAGSFAPRPGFGQILADVPDRFLPLGYLLGFVPAFIPASAAAALLYENVGVLFWLVAAALLLRSFRLPAVPGNRLDMDRARALLQASGGGNLAWMTTWSGNEYWFSPSGRSFVAYRVHFSVALTVGGPVGPAEELENVVDGFIAFCSRLGWVPCFYSVGADVRRLTEQRGWGHVQVAEDTVLDLGRLSFSGRKFQDVRTALNRAEREGIRAEWHGYASAPRTVVEQIRAIDEEWVADRDLPEMGFTLGGLAELADPQVRLVTAVDEEDRIHGVASWLPVYRGGRVAGWTLDYMRRIDGGFRPTIEFLIASAALQLKAEGYGFISLSGAPLARSRPESDGPAEADGAAGLDAFLDWLGAVLEPVYGFRSLLAFKEKFQPGYLPLFLAYPDPAALPRIGNAVARAYLPNVSARQTVALLQKVLDRKH